MASLAFSQKGYNTFSVEMDYGFNIPVKPTDDIALSNYIIPRHIGIGVRYMFDTAMGIKIDYNYDRFQDKNNKNTGNSYHRLGLLGILNVGKITGAFESKTFNLNIHGGVGITYAFPEAVKRLKNGGEFTFGLEPKGLKDYERIGNILLGISPKLKLSDRMALSFNATYVLNSQHQYGYNGELLHEDWTKIAGEFFNATIGIQFYIGRYNEHADWVD
ncbi:hypothetical protein MHTCC0001_33920 [Flavobacteriaceae bacterium MHTCC 0001]